MQKRSVEKFFATFGRETGGNNMSRVGNQPVSIPTGVTVEVSGQTVTVKGAKGECSYTAPACIAVEAE